MTAKNAEAAATAFALVLLVVPLVARACERFGVLDRPGPLKIHTRPIPRLGGLAIAAAVLAGISVTGALAFTPWQVLLAFALVWLAGFVDDLRGLPPLLRLTAQLLAGFLFWRAGLRVSAGVNAFAGLVCVCALVVLYVNALNFLDGSDGLAAGVAGIAALAFASVAWGAQHLLSAALASSLSAACAAFLIFNFPPARIFLGDSGSTLLGLSLAYLALDFYRAHDLSAAVAAFPVFVAALPLLDAAIAILRRLRQSRPVMEGDRCHLYDAALARGWTPKRIALAWYAISAAFAAIGLLALRANRPVFVALGVVVAAGLLVAAVCLGVLSRDLPPKGSTRNSALLRIPPLR